MTLTGRAKALRNQATDAERHLWESLRAKRTGGMKFRRQQPLGPYVVDFVNFEARLVIEVDGGQHASAEEQDRERDAWLRGKGFRVLRFWNHDIFGNREGVLDVILREASVPPLPNPPPPGGRE